MGLPLSQVSATREHLEVLLDPVGDLVQEHRGAVGRRGPAPARPWPRGRRRAPFSMSSAVERGISQNVAPVTGVTFSKYCPFTGAHPLAADEVVVARLELDLGAGLVRRDVEHGFPPLVSRGPLQAGDRPSASRRTRGFVARSPRGGGPTPRRVLSRSSTPSSTHGVSETGGVHVAHDWQILHACSS